MTRLRLLPALVVLAGLPAATASAATPARCPGTPIAASKTITGSFSAARQGSEVLLPFSVPKGTTAVRVKYCWDAPEHSAGANDTHVLDLGLYGPRRGGDKVWGVREFRGWGGSSHPDVIVSPRGFSSRAQYLKAPKTPVSGRTTRGFIPGPIAPGRWAVDLGVAAVVGPGDGDPDGVAWRVDLAFSKTHVAKRDVYRKARYSTAPARRKAGWYVGDMHVHAENSALGDATMKAVFDYAFKTAKLDFITLSDYVTSAGWGEIGRYQSKYPGHEIVRSAEEITYRGHMMNHGGRGLVDFRTGAIYQRRAGGALVKVRAARPASAILRAVHAAGDWTQVNHPTIYKSDDPAVRRFCRGCPWDYTDAQTGYVRNVDAIEVVTGPAGFPQAAPTTPNPFVPTAIDFYEHALALGDHAAAVGSSDAHHAGEADGPTATPVGKAATVVYADSLSPGGLQRAVEWGHTYAKMFGPAGPGLRLTARGAGDKHAAIFGDTVAGSKASFSARATGAPSGSSLVVVKNGKPWRSVPIAGGAVTYPFAADGRGRYGLEVVRGTVVYAYSTPIWVGKRASLRLAVAGPKTLHRSVRARCALSGTDARACTFALRRAGKTVARRRVLVTGGKARATLRVPRGATALTLAVTGADREGRTVVHRRTLRR